MATPIISGDAADTPGVDLRRLRYFIAVCDHGGISKAAHAIGIAQPALTRQIKLLEQEIGFPLIKRSGRGAEPSEEGRYILDRSRSYLEELASLVREARALFSAPRRQATLGICPTISPLFLDDIERFVRENHPEVALSAVQAYSGDLQNLMERGRLDIALTYRPTAQGDTRTIDLFSERLVVLSGNPAQAARARLGLDEVASLRLILPSRIHELRRIIDRIFEARGVALAPDLELDSLDAVKGMLQRPNSQHATILPYYGVKQEIEAGLYSASEIADPAMRRTISIVMPPHARGPDFLDRLAEHIVRRAEQMGHDLEAP